MKIALFLTLALWTIIIGLVLWLTGCAERSITFLQSQPKLERQSAFATLSSSNSRTEMTASSVYTRLELLRYRIDDAVIRGCIGLVQAQSYRHQADGIQKAVDQARADRRLMVIDSQSHQLDSVIHRLAAEVAASKKNQLQ